MRRSKKQLPFTGQDVRSVWAQGRNAIDAAQKQLSAIRAEIFFSEQSARMYRSLGINPPSDKHLRKLKERHKELENSATHLLRVVDMFHERIASKICSQCAGVGKQCKRTSPYPAGVVLIWCDTCNGTGMKW